MTDQDRIKLAEAMGWTNTGYLAGNLRGDQPSIIGYTGDFQKPLPDPFTDANDDYAVLEWMREHDGLEFDDFFNELDGISIFDYRVGFYARAALRVINDQTSQGEGQSDDS